VEECLEILKSGAGAGDIMELYYALTATMLVLSGVVPNLKQATKRAEEVLKNGFSSRKFREVVKVQGGNLSFIDHPENYPPAKFSLPVHASKSGFVHKISARACGDAAMLLGAGRKQIEDRIDYSAGIKFLKKPGQQVSKGDIIAVLYSNLKGKVLQVSKDFPNFIIIGKNPVPKSQMIHKVIKKNSALSWSEFCYSS
jgi:thymidine phosphorylase